LNWGGGRCTGKGGGGRCSFWWKKGEGTKSAGKEGRETTPLTKETEVFWEGGGGGVGGGEGLYCITTSKKKGQ